MHMQGVAVRFGMGLVAVLMTTAATTAQVSFQAPHPGADLEPVGNAETVIQLVQGQRSMLWTSLGAPVSAYTVTGWPSRDGDVELGGALMIHKPADGIAGVIAFGEKPMSLRFELSP